MEDFRMVAFYSFLSLVPIIISLNLFLRFITKPRLNLPPSPPRRLPVIGHLHLVKPPVHRALRTLSDNLRLPIISLRLGSRNVFVVSSLSVAEECFSTNDVVLAARPKLVSFKHLGYGFTTMISTSYGDHWRNLRRISALEIFSSHRLSSFLSVRKDEIRQLIIRLSANSLQGFTKVEMRSKLTDLTLNNLMRMVAGKRYYGGDGESEEEAKYARKLIADCLSITGAGNAGNYLPILNWLSGYEEKVRIIAGKMDSFLQGLIDEKRKEEKGNTMIHHLLSLQETQPEYYTDQIIKGMMMVLVLAGTDTSAVSLEWALSDLLNHPESLKKARTEIDNRVGSDRLIGEQDLANLPYLQNILSETFRLHTPAPLLLPHMASENCKVAGYDVPRGTMILVNAWAINRDPKLWEEPDSYRPERFEEVGAGQKLLVFGLGRRACPGSGLAQRLVGLTLGSLIQCFEWERIDEEKVDMSEGKGFTMPKATPLEALFKARPIASKILSDNI